ncbi:MAG: hypothetical protein F6K08_02290 [Okeania sp. SIO1H6]|nr:hypothetical protein [Okeania sp. SIO1H6]
MNPQFITTTNVNNNSDNTKDTKSQQCMSDSVTKSYNTFFGDEYVPKSHITTHPFNLTLEELSSLLKNGPEFGDSVAPLQEANSQTPELPSDKDSRGSYNDLSELFEYKPVGDSGQLNKSKNISQFNNGQKKCVIYETPESPSNKDSRGSHKDLLELWSYKPVGGSGCLSKYTKLKSTKNGLVEYPRVKEGQRSPNSPEHWYWTYRWQKKGKNGQPLYKRDGSPVIESTYCPQKKVRAVERAIAAKLPHRQILGIIKGENSTRPPT